MKAIASITGKVRALCRQDVNLGAVFAPIGITVLPIAGRTKKPGPGSVT